MYFPQAGEFLTFSSKRGTVSLDPASKEGLSENQGFRILPNPSIYFHFNSFSFFFFFPLSLQSVIQFSQNTPNMDANLTDLYIIQQPGPSNLMHLFLQLPQLCYCKRKDPCFFKVHTCISVCPLSLVNGDLTLMYFLCQLACTLRIANAAPHSLGFSMPSQLSKAFHVAAGDNYYFTISCQTCRITSMNTDMIFTGPYQARNQSQIAFNFLRYYCQ